MKSRIYKYIILFTIVFFSISNLFLTIYKDLGRKFLYSNQVTYFKGDLFEMSHVLYFQDKLTSTEKIEETHTIDDADIITMGDSFFNVDYDSAKLPNLLEKTTNRKVFNVERPILESYKDNPLRYLKETGYKKGDKKYLILETVERYSIGRSTCYTEKLNNPALAYPQEKAPILWYKPIQTRIPIDNLKYFFYNNEFVCPILDLGKTIKFSTTKEIDGRTPAYSLQPLNLFYFEDVDFAKNSKSDDNIKSIASGIEYLASELNDQYNLELIYVLIPNKFTIYGDSSNIPIPYDNYIPRVVGELNKRGIKSPELYTIFKSAAATNKDPLYYKADTHYRPIAKNLTVNEIIKLVKK